MAMRHVQSRMREVYQRASGEARPDVVSDGLARGTVAAATAGVGLERTSRMAPPPVLVLCREPTLLHWPGSAALPLRMTADWEAFAAAYPMSECAVVLAAAPFDRSLAQRVGELRRRHPLPSLVVATPLDASHLLPWRRVPVDEFVDPGAGFRDTQGAVRTGIVQGFRERLARHFEATEPTTPLLRALLAGACRDPRAFPSVRSLARQRAVTARTIENHWQASATAFSACTGLHELLWAIRLTRALEERAQGVSVVRIAEDLGADLRSLQRAARRQLGRSLGAVVGEQAADEVVRLWRGLLRHPLAASWTAACDCTQRAAGLATHPAAESPAWGWRKRKRVSRS